MPSPIGHSLMGLALQRWAPASLPLRGRRRAAIAVALANLPDLDFLPGFLSGEPGRFHHGASHSLGAAALFGALAGWAWAGGGMRRWIAGALWAFLLVSSHITLDVLSLDTAPPYGAPILWPVSERYIRAPVAIFPDVRKGRTAETFLPQLLSLHNLRTAAVEVALLAPFLWATWRLRPAARSRSPREEVP